jgi:uncharacterized protein (DUF488 family)
MEKATPRLLSVGHSNHELPDFLDLLRAAEVQVIADVRSSPWSRRLPQFNKTYLERVLPGHDIEYVFLGDSLGGRPGSTALYDDEGRVDYERVRETEAFQRGLDRLLLEAERRCVAMLCSEEDPLDCHRGLMIAPALIQRGVSPLHLHKDGWLETSAELEARLLEESGEAHRQDLPLFPPTEEEWLEALANAYRWMARRKAFRLQAEDPHSSEDA